MSLALSVHMTGVTGVLRCLLEVVLRGCPWAGVVLIQNS